MLKIKYIKITHCELQIARFGQQLVQILITQTLLLDGHSAAVFAILHRFAGIPEGLRNEWILLDQL